MVSMVDAIILMIIFYAFLFGSAFILKFVSPNTASITRDKLVIGRTSIPWSNIKHIALKKSEYGNLYLLIHFRDGTSPKSFDTDYLKNRKEFFHCLQDVDKRFTFTVDEGVDIDAEPEKFFMKREEEAPEREGVFDVEETREKTIKETPKPKIEINLSARQKSYIMVILAALFFGGFYMILGAVRTISLFLVVLVHEIGHLVALKLCGMRVHGLFFIPFIGGGVLPKDKFPSPEVEAAVALAGPAMGLSWNYVAQLVGVFSNFFLFQVFYYAVILNVVINLLNLMPILPLDGGRVVRAALLRGKKSLIPVIIITSGSGVFLGVYLNSVFIMMVTAIGLGSLVHSYRQLEKEEVEPPEWWKSVLILGMWVAIILLLWYDCPSLYRASIGSIF
ncbi:MAG: site-2 protease family protein [Theionarchaea archaeon]|nr:site-2 protease family protein [Theionarchaea archaeon]